MAWLSSGASPGPDVASPLSAPCKPTSHPSRNPPSLFDLAAGWEDDETPGQDVLPQPGPGCGYLNDAASRPLSPLASPALTAWAEQLHAVGSCLVVAGNQRDWQGDSRFGIEAVRPDAVQVARNHLAECLTDPTRAHWLQPSPAQGTPCGGFLCGPAALDPTAGALSGLITRGVSPADAVAITERLRTIRPERLVRAVQQRDDRYQSDAREQGLKEIRRIRDEVLLWTNFPEKALTETGTRGQDRVMLLSAACLEGAPLEVCIRAVAAFGPDGEPVARRFREGRSPRRRLRDIGVDVTAEDKAAFDSRPGPANAAIRMHWHH